MPPVVLEEELTGKNEAKRKLWKGKREKNENKKLNPYA